MIKQLQAVLDAGTTIGNLGEIVLAKRLLISKAEWTMVRRHYLQAVPAKALPKLWLIAPLAQWRREDILCALPARIDDVLEREQEILRTGLSEGGQAAVARLAHLVQRVFAG